MAVDEMEDAFKTYFEEMDRCVTAKCYWALLHMVVVMPDICAALESDDGEADDGRYRNWCKRYLSTRKFLSPDDWHEIRCALLHQGRTVPKRGRYGSYSFVQPAPSGDVVHNWVADDRNITLDVGEMAREMKAAIRSWFIDLQDPTKKSALDNVRKHLPWLAREKPKIILGGPSITGTNFSSTSSGS